MIKSFNCRETEKIYHHQYSTRLPEGIQRVALRKLYMMNGAISLMDLKIPPSNRLEKLQGKRQGQWSIRINDQWRICFRWHEGNAYDVEIVDYH